MRKMLTDYTALLLILIPKGKEPKSCGQCGWAGGLWHLAYRLLRRMLSQTVAFSLNHRTGDPPLQLAKLLH
jgi:hypothetical protein